MVYVNSSYIKMYPSAFRGQITDDNNPDIKYAFDPESRMFTEENTTRIARLLSRQRNGSFIINEAGTSVSQLAELEFVLGGYYFRIDHDGINDIGLKNGTWYASIRVTGSEDSNVAANKRLVNLADSHSVNLDVQLGSDYKFGALQLTNEEPTDSTLIKMLLVKDGKIPTASTLKFRRQDISGNNAGTQSLDNLLETQQVNTSKIVTKEILATTDQKLVIKNPKKSINIDVGSNNVLDQNFVVSYNNNEKIKVQNANTILSNNDIDILGLSTLIRSNNQNTNYVSLADSTGIIAQTSEKHIVYVGNVAESIKEDDATKKLSGIHSYEKDLSIKRYNSSAQGTIYSDIQLYHDSGDSSPVINLVSYYNDRNKSNLTVADENITMNTTGGLSISSSEDMTLKSTQEIQLISSSGILANGSIKSYDIYPQKSATYNLGNSSNKYNYVYSNNIVIYTKATLPSIETASAPDNRIALNDSGYKSNLPIKLYNSTTFNDNTTLTIKLTPDGGEIEALKFIGKSDERLKENIEDFDYTKSILDLPVHTYNFKSDEKKEKQIGCIAQELQKLYPELVSEDENGMLGVQENKLIYLLLEEVKRLDKRVKELESK